MFFYLLALLIGLPIIELWILLEIGKATSVGFTLGLIILTGAAGAYLARSQGFQVFMNFQRATQEGRMPSQEIIDGLFILVGGAVLLTPGILTDVFGFLCLIPVTRHLMQKRLIERLKKKMKDGSVYIDVDYKDM